MRALALTAVALVAACGGDGGTPDSFTFSLSLGTADQAGKGFTPLAGDQTLMPGSQGGFHVLMKYRLCGMRPQAVKLRRTARLLADERPVLVVPEQRQIVGDPAADGCWETPAAAAWFMCPSPVGISVKDQAVRFELVVSDDDGHELASTRSDAVLRCPAGAQGAFCDDICTG